MSFSCSESCGFDFCCFPRARRGRRRGYRARHIYEEYELSPTPSYDSCPYSHRRSYFNPYNLFRRRPQIVLPPNPFLLASPALEVLPDIIHDIAGLDVFRLYRLGYYLDGNVFRRNRQALEPQIICAPPIFPPRALFRHTIANRVLLPPPPPLKLFPELQLPDPVLLNPLPKLLRETSIEHQHRHYSPKLLAPVVNEINQINLVSKPPLFNPVPVPTPIVQPPAVVKVSVPIPAEVVQHPVVVKVPVPIPIPVPIPVPVPVPVAGPVNQIINQIKSTNIFLIVCVRPVRPRRGIRPLLTDPNQATNIDPLATDEMVGIGGRLMRDEELEDILANTISNCFGSDWFSRNTNTRLGPLRSLAGYTSSERGLQEGMITDMIRKHNLAVQLANNMVSINSMVSQIHPKVIDSGPDAGRFPRDFELPQKIEWFGRLNDTTLDSILTAYDITPRSLSETLTNPLRGLSWYENGLLEMNRVRDELFEIKLLFLFEFLGVDFSELARDGDRSGLGLSGRFDDGGLLGRRNGRLGGGRLLGMGGDGRWGISELQTGIAILYRTFEDASAQRDSNSSLQDEK
ncbi:uncharacterized protein LY89DRAFT_780634 [Mollisia scopiformis]|uniref:Uncharacterized protein n=1 Tax=Mollisia scopiformis TaxID=149040 RepID=A0A194XFN7_MOLSC|nr:uncharacterized protein LY89DRAFT_780634 [Mollisia scopiformis]KUJ18587.1 hypothetical protein LY89DRAFT_780634 [Mollisia scopiformis]